MIHLDKEEVWILVAGILALLFIVALTAAIGGGV